MEHWGQSSFVPFLSEIVEKTKKGIEIISMPFKNVT